MILYNIFNSKIAKHRFPISHILVILLLLLFPVSAQSDQDDSYMESDFSEFPELTESYESAIVVSIHDATEEEKATYGLVDLMEGEVQTVELLMESGPYKGRRYNSMLVHMPGLYGEIKVDPGDRLSVIVEDAGSGPVRINIADHDRKRPQLFLFFIFCAALIAVGGARGLRALIGLGITVFMMFAWLIPMILDGYPPVLSAMLICSIASIISVLLIAGFTRKTGAALAGTVAGVALSGIIAMAAGAAMKLTGVFDESTFILIHSLQSPVDFKGLLYAGMLVGSMGAVMDIAMSIAASVMEVSAGNPSLSPAQLFKSGMNVGRDMTGTMANTLVMAYVGSSLPLALLIFAQGDMPMAKVWSLEIIAVEVTRSISGSIGLFAAVPVTAFVAAGMSRINQKNRRKRDQQPREQQEDPR